jgi:hypothetical protein
VHKLPSFLAHLEPLRINLDQLIAQLVLQGTMVLLMPHTAVQRVRLVEPFQSLVPVTIIVLPALLVGALVYLDHPNVHFAKMDSSLKSLLLLNVCYRH